MQLRLDTKKNIFVPGIDTFANLIETLSFYLYQAIIRIKAPFEKCLSIPHPLIGRIQLKPIDN